MIRVILSWLGWAFIAFGLLEIAYETFVLLQSEIAKDDVISSWPRSKFFGRGFSNIALGAIMVGVYQLLIKSDEKEKE